MLQVHCVMAEQPPKHLLSSAKGYIRMSIYQERHIYIYYAQKRYTLDLRTRKQIIKLS